MFVCNILTSHPIPSPPLTSRPPLSSRPLPSNKETKRQKLQKRQKWQKMTNDKKLQKWQMTNEKNEFSRIWDWFSIRFFFSFFFFIIYYCLNLIDYNFAPMDDDRPCLILNKTMEKHIYVNWYLKWTKNICIIYFISWIIYCKWRRKKTIF